jgi:hypothetical protein
VCRLVSGYPPGKRENRVMVVLTDPQLAADASGNEPQSPVFVIAGFVAPAAKWADFSAAWQVALDEPPKLDYFKMNEAASMSGQFHPRRGWTEAKRDDRLVTLARIIKDHTSVRVSAWIRHADYNKYILPLPALVRHLGVDSPYVLLVHQLILAIAVMGDRHGIITPPDYIFDTEKSFDEEIFANWPTMKWLVENSTKSDLAKFFGDRPIFRDDKSFLPLQAADLYAWQVRNRYIQTHQVPKQTLWVPPTRALGILDRIGVINREYSTDEVVRLRDVLVARGKLFAEANPGVQLIPPHSDPKERRKAHKQARKARKAIAKPLPSSSGGQSS